MLKHLQIKLITKGPAMQYFSNIINNQKFYARSICFEKSILSAKLNVIKFCCYHKLMPIIEIVLLYPSFQTLTVYFGS